ncbi:hypothetical protein ACI2JA_19680 [Alkalihalobacillus sp. NPDC078783]|uniref:hypothetical protein n=1 Tax=Streptomyces albidoflavus TaxID=1886 RepID=UPI0033CB1F99
MGTVTINTDEYLELMDVARAFDELTEREIKVDYSDLLKENEEEVKAYAATLKDVVKATDSLSNESLTVEIGKIEAELAINNYKKALVLMRDAFNEKIDFLIENIDKKTDEEDGCSDDHCTCAVYEYDAHGRRIGMV